MVRASQTVVEVGDPAIKQRRQGQPARTLMSFLLHKQGMSFDRVIDVGVERVQRPGLTWDASNCDARAWSRRRSPTTRPSWTLTSFTDAPTR